MEKKPEPTVIRLNRGSSGLGFNIRGGIDQPLLPYDNGIFVTKIRDVGSAAEDGRLREGDKILEINGNSLLNVRHAVAVDLFVKAEETVKLLVWSGAERYLANEYSESRRQKEETRPLTKVLLFAGVVSIVAVAVYFWKSKRSNR